MDYFIDILTTFLGLECGSSVAMQKIINDNVINRIFIFAWTIPLSTNLV